MKPLNSCIMGEVGLAEYKNRLRLLGFRKMKSDGNKQLYQNHRHKVLIQCDGRSVRVDIFGKGAPL